MAQDQEQSQKCSNSSSGGGCGGGGGGVSTSKKGKQKKVPQRGLGVAQLEKIRLEEQQKKDLATKSSFLSVTLPNFHQTNQPSSSSISFPSPTTGLPSPNSLFRPPIDVSQNSSTVPLPNSVGWPPIPSPGHVMSVSKLWSSCDYNTQLEKESSGVDPGLAFRSNLTFPYESNPMWHIPSLIPRSQPFQEPSSMVNVSSAPSSSSVLNFQTEPPSNQSYYSNFRPMWHDEEKMVGMKRPYPFSMENPPCPSSFHCKLPTIAHPVSDESASCGNGSAFALEPSHPIFREVPSCSTSMSQLISKKIKENTGFGGDFLTLGPPTSHAPKFKQTPGYITFPNRELPDFDSLPYQGSAEDPMFQSGPSGWNQQQHHQPAFHSFLPPAKVLQTSQATTSMNCYNVEVGESIDLNLKL